MSLNYEGRKELKRAIWFLWKHRTWFRLVVCSEISEKRIDKNFAYLFPQMNKFFGTWAGAISELFLESVQYKNYRNDSERIKKHRFE